MRIGAYLVGTAVPHRLNGHAHEFGGDAAPAPRLSCGEHGDVAADGSGAVWLELAHDDAYECGVVCGVYGLCDYRLSITSTL